MVLMYHLELFIIYVHYDHEPAKRAVQYQAYEVHGEQGNGLQVCMLLLEIDLYSSITSILKRFLKQEHRSAE